MSLHCPCFNLYFYFGCAAKVMILKVKCNTTSKINGNLSNWLMGFVCNMYLVKYQSMLTYCAISYFFTYFLLSCGQRKLWSRVLFIFSVSPQGPHIALEMSVGSLLWRGALTFPPHPHWQPMCQLVAFSTGVGVWEVENMEEREAEEKKPERACIWPFLDLRVCVCVCVTRPQTSDIPFAMT